MNMTYVLCRHKVDNYESWRPYFDGHGVMLAKSGALGGHVLSTSGDPNELWVLLEWDSEENARRFMSSPELKDTMRQSGVIDTPDVYFLNELAKPNIRLDVRIEEPSEVATPA
jgi:uncharacterized protein (DUF1330 family)